MNYVASLNEQSACHIFFAVRLAVSTSFLFFFNSGGDDENPKRFFMDQVTSKDINLL